MTKEIPLTRGYVALVDDGDYEYLMQWKWHEKDGYAYHCENIGGRKTKCTQMHRLLLNAPAGLEVDHQDHNGLNNCRSNIRLATHSENGFNQKRRADSRYQYKGVYIDQYNSWRARIVVNKKTLYSCRCATEADAARAYDEMARKHFGEFAYLNFPEVTI